MVILLKCNKNIEIRLLKKENLNEIKKLYLDIKNNTYTLQDENYPSEELILWDIERKGLWGVFYKQTLISVTYVGERCEDGEENFTWQHIFKKRGTFARIGVSPKYQNKGIGTKLVSFVLQKLESQGFDGLEFQLAVRIQMQLSYIQSLVLQIVVEWEDMDTSIIYSN